MVAVDVFGQAQPGQQPVTGGGQVAVDDVAALLAADAEPAAVERLEHVAIADRRGDHVDAGGVHRPVETDVAHHRDHHRVVVQVAELAQLQCREGDEAIAVDDSTEVVDRDHPVAVAVEGQTQRRAVGDDGVAERRGVRRPAVVVDVAAVGRGVDDRDLGTERGEHGRGDLAHRPVGAIEHDAQPARATRANRPGA